ncbi:hypothetical protein [Arthrobacter mobilis]|uniref:Uncharacterized protein n=1 Tax=Arthrobacter mobilis TaxID=2724944 RepID=A0A7X6HCL0_9MICC|nr:hypothetical protein [Arthrobacter mobilis]NKX54657.1 hypothetical protein [Arthrobacter mobilis]
MLRRKMPAVSVDNKALAAYLNSHLAGAAAGRRMFHAAKRTWVGTEAAAVLDEIERQVHGERQELKQLMHDLGYRRSLVMALVARAGALAGRVNPVNLLRRGRSTGGQLELELLQSALRGKEALWRTLLELQQALPQLNRRRLAELLERTRRQQDAVAGIMRRTALQRFAK